MKKKSPRGKKGKSLQDPQDLQEPEVLPAEESDDEGDALAAEEEPSEEDIAEDSMPVPASIDPDLGAVSPNDPLRRYLDEVRRYPLLEPEEEFRLATQLRD